VGEMAFGGCEALTPAVRAAIEKRFGEEVFWEAEN
jgi:hypothetical protein